MSSTPSEIPEEDLARLRESLQRALQPQTNQIREALARIHTQNAVQLEALRAGIPNALIREPVQRLLREALAPTNQARMEMLARARNEWVHGIRRAMEASGSNPFAAQFVAGAPVVDGSPLGQLLRDMGVWRQLTAEQRAQAVAVAEETYQAASPDEVSDETVDDLADLVRDFAGSEAQYLPLGVRRQSFVAWVGGVALSALMVFAFTSDTADGVMTKALELSGAAGLAMIAAGKAWDRHYRTSGDGAEQDDRN
ncbi:hypothetical protein AB0900_31925 [Streptomyces cellulosae]|uniref:DUF2335 domain-containing protein n=2 Tax=Streptomyces TaxID=1883 RepID=A0ABU3JGD9_9ACTN|nr:hypothetical protein [Streptomyces sp. McG8]MDQ0491279.1 hypothetical protein [Streptomyces thermodiastaticus]MDT6974132.1 hypothetical protein [Streptomyces thermocarboxydus]WSB39348.1 hypothetical protein OG853_00090 [Streptomyces cellulosae]UVT13706.1 hypothetical protein AY578_33465 [Streptomyces thermocarboxydus]